MFSYCSCVRSVQVSTLTGDEPAEQEGGRERVPNDADTAEGVGRLVPALAGARQAGEQRQHHCEDAHHDQVDGDVGLPWTLVQVDGTCASNSGAGWPGCFYVTLRLCSRRRLTNGNVGNGEDAKRHLGRHCKKIRHRCVCFVMMCTHTHTHNLSSRVSVAGCGASPRIAGGGWGVFSKRRISRAPDITEC